MIAALLTGGRTSRLYQALVEQQQIALGINVSTGFPGDRFPGLMLLYATTVPGRTVDEIATVMDAEIERLKTELVSPAELDRVKTQTRASLLRTLASNEGMAALLPEYEANTGDWRNLFNQLQRIEAITPADVQRVAQEIFQPSKVTVGRLLPQAE
jgi:predicted Zn-dependent peptidase